jgi:hypothetical protein
VHRASGAWDCLLDIPRWSWHWMRGYALAEPVRFEPGDLVYVECHWDNSPDNQPFVDGERAAPRDLHWGADQEMCAASLLYTDGWP